MIDRVFFSLEVADGVSSPLAVGMIITAQIKMESDMILIVRIIITQGSTQIQTHRPELKYSNQ